APDAAGDRATGTLDLHLERGRSGDDAVLETVRARFHDQYQRTDEGWRIRRRDVRLITE
ncbi:MAG: nuclear transport factor 2 family protein, partial [Panacagrimonas sp.]